MRLAHIVQVTPHKAGLYETARDLAEAEIKAGHDAVMIDPIKNRTGEDRGVKVTDRLGVLNEADVVVNHSGINKEMSKTIKRPIVHMMHGRPYSSFILEQTDQIAIYSYWQRIAKDPRFKAFVTFWPEYVPYFAAVLPQHKIKAITPPVNLDRWTPDGPRGYDFHGQAGKRNIVCADMWRHDIDPYHIIHAFLFYARTYEPGARLHVYAQPKGGAWDVLKAALGDNLGECVGYVQGLEHVYRAADAVISPHRIATRSVRESLACDTPLVMANGNNYTKYKANPEDIPGFAYQIDCAVKERDANRGDNRANAEMFFNPADTADQFIKILNGVNNGIE